MEGGVGWDRQPAGGIEAFEEFGVDAVECDEEFEARPDGEVASLVGVDGIEAGRNDGVRGNRAGGVEAQDGPQGIGAGFTGNAGAGKRATQIIRCVNGRQLRVRAEGCLALAKS